MKNAPLNIGIVGVGLIGGSLGMALRRDKRGGRRRFRVIGIGRSKAGLNAARRRGAVDAAFTDVAAGLSQADVVVICIPVHKIVSFVEKNIRRFKRGAVITDAGSVKGPVAEGIRKALKKRPDLHFAGGHPVAGSEKTGVENAKADLFKNATCVLTQDHASFKALDTARSLWTAAGAKCVLMTAAAHDRWLALTSHLPHLLAFALFGRVDGAAQKTPLVRSLAGGSFRDMTRIAGADPELWTGIIQTNRKEIQKSLKEFSKELSFFANAPAGKLKSRLKQLAKAKTRLSHR